MPLVTVLSADDGAQKPKNVQEPLMVTADDIKFQIGGEVGNRLEAVTQQWIFPVPSANPALLSMYRDRDIKPYRSWDSWSGEFAGKYLTSSTQILRLTNDPKLRKHLEGFVDQLLACQDENGYLGVASKENQLKNNKQAGWDAWSHYHLMMGFIFWHDLTKDEKAFSAAEKIADLFCNIYLGEGKNRLTTLYGFIGNLAPIHSFCLLYKQTGNPKYFAMAKQLLVEIDEKDDKGVSLNSAILTTTLEGKEFFQHPSPRWESIHALMSLPDFYYLTGDEKYKKIYELLWWSMLKGDRHNQGGFSSGERICGNPYNQGSIETCCTVAWMAMSVEMLHLTGNSVVADELEFSLLNSGLGLMSRSGRWVTYNTPMDGARLSAAQTIGIHQARPGSPELNCCAVNGPRVLGLLSEWALLKNAKGAILNYYGPSTNSFLSPSGNAIILKQVTEYPRNPQIDIEVESAKEGAFTLALRIPYWSDNTQIWVDEKKAEDVKKGTYFLINRKWSGKTHIRLVMDFGLQFWRHPEPEFLKNALKNYNGLYTVITSAVEADDNPLKTVTDLEDAKKTSKYTFTEVKSDMVDFKEMLSKNTDAKDGYCFVEYNANSDGVFLVNFGSSHGIYSCWVNGLKVEEKIYTALFSHAGDPLRIPVKQGKNLLGFRVSKPKFMGEGWKINLRMGNFLTSQELQQQSTYASIYRGPILLTYDMRFNDTDSANRLPMLGKPILDFVPVWTKVPSDNPWVLVEGKDAEGKVVRYCDFASAGAGGNLYFSWVPINFSIPMTAKFTKENPRRSTKRQSENRDSSSQGGL